MDADGAGVAGADLEIDTDDHLFHRHVRLRLPGRHIPTGGPDMDDGLRRIGVVEAGGAGGKDDLGQARGSTRCLLLAHMASSTMGSLSSVRAHLARLE
jgi:hypothetical protein